MKLAIEDCDICRRVAAEQTPVILATIAQLDLDLGRLLDHVEVRDDQSSSGIDDDTRARRREFEHVGLAGIVSTCRPSNGFVASGLCRTGLNPFTRMLTMAGNTLSSIGAMVPCSINDGGIPLARASLPASADAIKPGKNSDAVSALSRMIQLSQNLNRRR